LAEEKRILEMRNPIIATIAIAAAVLMPGGLYAKPLSALSCNDLLQESRTDSSFDLSALGYSIVDRANAYITSHLNDTDLAKLGSGCNVSSYVYAECRIRPNSSVMAAINRLISKARSGAELPYIPICGT
jgi:hypothetical protein